MVPLPTGDHDAPIRAAVRSLKLTAFRNYAAAAVELDGRHVVLTGPNGAGKTNLMEAVSLLSPGRGLRRATLADMVHKGASDGFSVFVNLERDGDSFAIGTGTAGQTASDGAVSRRLRVNGTPARSVDDLMEMTRVIWLTPSMDGLFTGPAGDRRRFIDRMVLAIDPEHGRRSSAYEKAMRQRNRLLDDGAYGSAADIMLDAIEAQMAALGTAIMAARQDLVASLAALMSDQAAGASDFPTGIMALEGELEIECRRGVPAIEIETLLVQTLRTMRGRDRAARRTLTGPHRADLAVHHREKDIAAALCSTGEQKALLTGLVLAHARLTRNISGMTPILLLDEIAAHLDPQRRAALFERIDALGGQAFMTGTDRTLFAALEGRAQFVHVANATLTGDMDP